MNSQLEDIFRNYAWDYFALHANQRLKTFQFYITLATATLAGFFALVQSGHAQKWLCVLGLVLTLFSFVFWMLDKRTRNLVKNAEEALKFLDEQEGLPDIGGAPHPLRMFSRDDHIRSKARRWSSMRHCSYSLCFNLVFAVFAVLGLAAAIWALWFLPAQHGIQADLFCRL